VLFSLAFGLTVVGVLFVHSTTPGDDPFPSGAARAQILKAVVAIAGFLVVSRLDYRLLDHFAWLIYGAGVLVLSGLLGVKLLFGGLQSSIRFDLFQVQPSEFMKIALVLALARYLRYREDQRQVLGLAAPFLITVLPMALVLLQPDLGTSLMFPPVLLGMLLVAGARPRHLALALLGGLLLLPAAYFLGDRLPLVRDYQRDRIIAYVHRDEVTRQNQGLQLHQSEIAIGSGGLLGKGYTQGTQNRYSFVPEDHTDFIYSIIGEETGFVGAFAVLLSYVLLIVLILNVAIATREPFGRLVAAGIAVAFAAQTLENLGMTMGLTPITGLPLPFVSYGGSSLVTSYLALGIVVAVARRPVRVVASRDLSPRERRRVVLVPDRPAGLIHRLWPVD
jgi:rod shape determining protein RodA